MFARPLVWLQVGGIQHNDSDKHIMSQAGQLNIDESFADVDQDDAIDEDLPHNDGQMHDEMQGDDDARDMSMEPPEQSGYPADPGDDEDEENGETPSEQVDLTADLPVSRKGRTSSDSKARGSTVITVSDGSNDDGSENIGLRSVEPEGSINMQSTHDSSFLAAVKKQSKVKEGDWMQVRQQSNSGDYGLIDID